MKIGPAVFPLWGEADCGMMELALNKATPLHVVPRWNEWPQKAGNFPPWKTFEVQSNRPIYYK